MFHFLSVTFLFVYGVCTTRNVTGMPTGLRGGTDGCAPSSTREKRDSMKRGSDWREQAFVCIFEAVRGNHVFYDYYLLFSSSRLNHRPAPFHLRDGRWLGLHLEDEHSG